MIQTTNNKQIILCGIDEAGRGPLAGPLVVAGVVLSAKIDGLMDSKKLSAKKREELFDKICANNQYKIVFKTNDEIDEFGLSKCLKDSILKIMDALIADEFLFDGNTTLGIKSLKTMVKADMYVPEVSAASILAKVSRDRFMDEISPQFSDFDFASHKGYGTKKHIEELTRFGQTAIHRKSFKLKSKDQNSLF